VPENDASICPFYSSPPATPHQDNVLHIQHLNSIVIFATSYGGVDGKFDVCVARHYKKSIKRFHKMKLKIWKVSTDLYSKAE
jgi:hypothetical protein